MKTNCQKIRWQILIMPILFVMLFPHSVMALEENTHRAINERIADRGSLLNNFSLHQYLTEQLELKDGVETEINKKLVIKWFGDGGEKEDNFLRYLNHFYSPLTNSGLWGNIPAKDWAIRPVGNQYAGDQYSWNDARDYYYKALTSTDKATRESNFAMTFRGVGQVMHLVQDMSVPAHTRNDSHGTGDGYELWARKFISDTAQVSTYSVSSFTMNDSSFLIPNLFDTDQYNGSNPALSNNIGLSEYSNANFLSPDTIFPANFTYPAYSDMSPRVEVDSISGKQILYLSKSGHGEAINYFARAGNLYNYLPPDYKKLALTLSDEKIYNNYAQLLIPRAVGYSSQVLSYFFRGRFDVEMDPGGMTITNASTEVMTGGRFELYYDNENGARNPVSNLTGAEVATLSPGSHQIITFNQPQSAESYMLVYKGMLGNETNAVIGKFIGDDKEFVMFTASVGAKNSVVVWNARNNSLVHGPVDFDDATFQAWYLSKETAGNSLFSNRTFCGKQPGSVQGSVLSGCQQLVPAETDEWTYSIVGGETGHDEYGLTWDQYCYVNWHNHALKYYSGVYPPQGNKDLAPESFQVGISLPGSPILYSGFRTEGVFTSTRHEMRGAQDTIGSTSGLAKETWTFYGPFGKMGEYTAIETGSGDIWDSQGTTTKNYIPGWTAITKNPEVFPGSNYAWGHYWYGSSMNGQYTGRTIANVCMVHYTDAVEYYRVENYDKIGWTFTPAGARTILVHAQALHYPDGSTGKNFFSAGRNTALESKILEAITMAYALSDIPENEIRNCQVSVNILK
jgi:hypothetical protein